MNREVQLEQIAIMADLLDDLEQVRKATANRIMAYERRREPLPEIADVFRAISEDEKLIIKHIEKMWRHHMLSDWTKEIAGAGDKTVARLIAEIGEPSLRAIGHEEQLPPTNGGGAYTFFVVDGYEERTPAQLLSYCGHGDPLRKKRTGMTQEELFRLGNPKAKMRVHLVADCLVKRQCIVCKMREKEDVGWAPPPEGCECAENYPFRAIYNARRLATLERKHETVCPPCGPSGHPALPGSPWSKKHQHMDGLRVVGKKFLVALWQESRRQRGLSWEREAVEV